MTEREALNLALGKIKSARDCHANAVDTLLFEAEEVLEEALAEQPAQQEPVNQRAHEMALRQWDHWKQYALELQEKLVKYEGGAPMVLNTSPPAQRKPLTDKEIWQLVDGTNGSVTAFARAIEAAHGIKENT